MSFERGLMNVPKHSIIYPNYNEGNFLSSTLDSILAQTFTDFEVIVVDDASTDNSRDILKAYARQDSRIRPYFNEKNLGVFGALAVGMKQACGNYLSFISSGDLNYPLFLETAHRFFQLNPQAKSWACHSDVYRESIRINQTDLNSYAALSTQFFSREDIVHRFRHSNLFLHGMSVVVNKATFTRYGGFSGHLGPYSDWLLFHKIALHEGLGYSPQFLTRLQISDHSYSRRIRLNRNTRHQHYWNVLNYLYLPENHETLKKFLEAGLLTSISDSLFWRLLRKRKYWDLLKFSKTSTKRRLSRVILKKLGFVKSTIPKVKDKQCDFSKQPP